MNSEDFRQWHYLKPTVGTRCPRRWIFVQSHAIETSSDDDVREKLLIHGTTSIWQRTFHNHQWAEGPSICQTGSQQVKESLISMLSSTQTTWIVGFRLSLTLELIDFWRDIERGCFTGDGGEDGHGDDQAHGEGGRVINLPQLVLSDPPLIISGTWYGKRVVMVDTRNYVGTHPAKMFPSVPEAAIVPPKSQTDLPAWERYLSLCNSCTSHFFEKALDVWAETGQGNWATTAPGLAWSSFRHNSVQGDEILIHGNADAILLERLGYYAGRCEVSFAGTVMSEHWRRERPAPLADRPGITVPGGVVELDVSSLYPSIMARTKLPTKLLGYRRGDAHIGHIWDKTDRQGCAFVRIKTDEPLYPCRVDRERKRPILSTESRLSRALLDRPQQTVWPVGTFDTVLIGSELQLAFRRGNLERVYCWAEYETRIVGSLWVDNWYDLKVRAQQYGLKASESLAKMVLNGLVGKFGQRSRRWVSRPEEFCVYPWGEWTAGNAQTGEIAAWRGIAGQAQEQGPDEEPDNSCPALAAAINAAARINVLVARLTLPRQSVYYQDTDSLWVRGDCRDLVSPCNTTSSPQLGQWCTRGEYDAAGWLAKRCYWTPLGWVVSGIKRRSAIGDSGTLESVCIDGAPTVLNRGPGKGARVRRYGRKLSLGDCGGVVTASGWVDPYEVSPAE